MAVVLVIVHILITLALIGVVLLQRSEGGALGMGGGGGGGFMTGRGAANFLTRVTAGLAAAFFATSLFLALISTRTEAPRSILDAPTGKVQPVKVPKEKDESSKPPSLDLNLPGAPPPDKPKTDAEQPPRVPQSK